MRNNNGEGYIGKTSKGLWTSRVQVGTKSDGKPKIKVFYGKAQKEVRKKLRDFQEKGEAHSDNLEMFGEYLFNWFTLYKKNDLRPATFDKYEDLINKHIYPQLGHIHMSALRADHL